MWKTVKQWRHPKVYIDRRPHGDKPCGYCHCERHRGFITVKLMRTHKCLEKQCSFLEKYEEHEHWQSLKRKKELKKERKRKRIKNK